MPEEKRTNFFGSPKLDAPSQKLRDFCPKASGEPPFSACYQSPKPKPYSTKDPIVLQSILQRKALNPKP